MDRLEHLTESMGNGRVTPPDDAQFETNFPFLWTLITEDQWGDGTERQLSTIQVDRVAGGFRVTLQDHALYKKKSAVALRWQDIPAALEAALDDSNVPWEYYKSYRNKKGPKVPEKPKGGRRAKR